MTAVEVVFAIVFFAIAGLLLFLGIRSFMERGFLLNNAYIYATKEERKTMNKKKYYRQSAVVFCLLREEKSFSQNEWAIPIGIAHFQKKDKLEFHSTERRNRINSPCSTLRGCDS